MDNRLHICIFLFIFVNQKITTMNIRISQFLNAENITQAQFADTIGVARASISHIIAGRNKPSYDFIASVLKHYPRINPLWLILGKGRMYVDQESKIDVASPIVPQIPDSQTDLLFPLETPQQQSSIHGSIFLGISSSGNFKFVLNRYCNRHCFRIHYENIFQRGSGSVRNGIAKLQNARDC